MLFVPGFYKTLWNYFCHLENLNKNRAPYFNKVVGNLETCVGVLRRCCVCNIRNIIRQQQAGGRAGAYHELHEDGGHARAVPGAHALEHVVAGGRLGAVLLLDRPELLQHLHLGVAQVGRHVSVPETQRQVDHLPPVCSV